MTPPEASPLQRVGVILAAGRGRRMGRTKQLVLWRGADEAKPLVAAAYDAVAEVCDSLVVVFGHEAEAVAGALGSRPFHPALSDPDADMFCSIQAGLKVARRLDETATVVLQPGDHPEVAPATLHAVASVSASYPDRAVIPEYQGRGGHPVFIPAKVVERLLWAECPEGLGGFWREHPDMCLRLSVDDPSICFDVDRPEHLRP